MGTIKYPESTYLNDPQLQQKPITNNRKQTNMTKTKPKMLRWKSMMWTTKPQRIYFQVIAAVTCYIPNSQLPFPCKLRVKLAFNCDLQLTYPGHRWFQSHLYWPLSDSSESIHGIFFLLCFTLFCVYDVTVNFILWNKNASLTLLSLFVFNEDEFLDTRYTRDLGDKHPYIFKLLCI